MKPHALVAPGLWLSNKAAGLKFFSSVGDVATLQKILGDEAASIMGALGGKIPVSALLSTGTKKGASTSRTQEPQATKKGGPSTLRPTDSNGSLKRPSGQVGGATAGQAAPKRKKVFPSDGDIVIDLTDSPKK